MLSSAPSVPPGAYISLLNPFICPFYYLVTYISIKLTTWLLVHIKHHLTHPCCWNHHHVAGPLNNITLIMTHLKDSVSLNIITLIMAHLKHMVSLNIITLIMAHLKDVFFKKYHHSHHRSSKKNSLSLNNITFMMAHLKDSVFFNDIVLIMAHLKDLVSLNNIIPSWLI